MMLNMLQSHYFVVQNRHSNIFQITYVADKEPYIEIINQEIYKIKAKYPKFDVKMNVVEMYLTFQHNNITICRELVDNIKTQLSKITYDDNYITISL